MIVKGLIINDLHFGIKDTKRLYEELKLFKEKLSEFKPNLLVVDGDYFDHKLSIGDPETYYAVSFFNEMLDICRREHITIRMVQGTRSHELNQLQLFKPHESDKDIDFKIIETVSEEDLFGLHILYLPEEYPMDSEEYYKDFKAPDKRYNIIFGHGTWDDIAFDSQIDLGAQTSTLSAPVFVYDNWKHTIPNGFISFGHIHSRHTFHKKLFYSGSYTRWGFGERSARGFSCFEYDTEKLVWKLDYIDNDLAPSFEVMSISELDESIKSGSVDEIKVALDARVSQADNIRIDLSGLPKDTLEILKKYYKDNQNVKIEVKEQTTIKEAAAVDKKEFEKWHYITKRQLPLNQTIKKYCSEELKKDIELDVIDKTIAAPTE